MNDINQRISVIASACIAGLAIAAWKVFVAPMHQSLAAASAQVAGLEDHIQSLEASDLPDSRTIRSDLARLEMQNAELARVTEPLDANQLRDRFRELALTHRIRVDRIERRTRTSASRESRSSAPVAREAAAFSMSLRGAYSDMAEFIQAVHAEPGINRITGIRISSPSAEEKGHVSAIVETSHLRLHMPVAAQPAQKKGRKS